MRAIIIPLLAAFAALYLAGCPDVSDDDDSAGDDDDSLAGDDDDATDDDDSAGDDDDATDDDDSSGGDPVPYCGDILVDTTWTADAPYLVTCDIHVGSPDDPTLTVEAGAQVLFEAGAGMYVGLSDAGRLEVQGTADASVLFTSAEEEPGPGDWDGLHLHDLDSGSSLASLTLEFAGGGDFGGLLVDGAAVQVVGSTVRDNDLHGVVVASSGVLDMSDTSVLDNVLSGVLMDAASELADGDDDPSFAGNTLTGNGAFPMTLAAGMVPQLDPTSSFVGNGEAVVQLVGGGVSRDQSWLPMDQPYLVSNNLSIQGASAPTLTLTEGVELRFEGEIGIYVGTGTTGDLVVQGGDDGVLMTSAEEAPAPGDWYGLKLGLHSEATVIDGLTLEYAGSNELGGVYTNLASPTITGSTFRHNAGDGAYFDHLSEPLVEDCAFEDNERYGVYLSGDSLFAGDGASTFVGAVVTGNGANPVALPASAATALAPDGTYTGNGADEILIAGSSMYLEGTLDKLDVDYRVSSTITVQGPSGSTVTVADGVEMRFDAGAGFLAGVAGPGAVVVDGHTDGVLFTSAAAAPAPGDWLGLQIGHHDGGSVIDGLTVEYGGGNTWGGLYTYIASPLITDSTFRDNLNHGATFHQPSFPEIHGCTFEDNELSGVWFHDNSGLATGAAPTFTGNTMTGNGTRPLVLYAADIARMDDTNLMTGNGDDVIQVWQDTLTEDATWLDYGVPYELVGQVHVDAPADPTLTIEAGTELRFQTGAGFQVGSVTAGSLNAVGTESAPILMTSASLTPAPGDWYGLHIRACDPAASIFEHITIEYAGSNLWGAFWSFGCEATVTDATIRFSSTWGIYRHSSTLTLTNVTYEGNVAGDLW